MNIKGSFTGFTLVEIMIVVVIFGLLASIAVPNYVSTKAEAEKVACISNLRQIDAVIKQWEFETSAGQGVELTPYANEIYAYIIGGEPKCPGNGTYILGNLGVHPQVMCSLGESNDHKLP